VSDLLALFDTAYFRVGLRLGLAALAAGWALRFAVGRERPPLPIAGVLVAGATLGGLYLTDELLGPTVLAVISVAAGVLGARLAKTPVWVQPLAAAPGAVWLAVTTPATQFLWVRILIALVVPLAGFLISDFEMRHDKMGLGIIFFTLATLGAFAAVPDTEQALIIGAASLAVSFLAWPRVAASLGPEGGYAAVACFLVVVAAGGQARPSSIIGSTACLGLLLLEPVVVWLKPSAIRLVTWVNRNWIGAVLASIPQFVVVVLCSRVAARFQTELPALIVVAITYALAIAAGFTGARRTAETVVG
jgi:hypothetical protein